jgi:heterodisulfide reductase subunit A
MRREVEKVREIIEDQIGKSLADSMSKIYADNHFGDVMIVGGGVSGVQASLDLAGGGFKVYLVDKAPAIGGHMAQLDKTFPTNDCSI